MTPWILFAAGLGIGFLLAAAVAAYNRLAWKVRRLEGRVFAGGPNPPARRTALNLERPARLGERLGDPLGIPVRGDELPVERG